MAPILPLPDQDSHASTPTELVPETHALTHLAALSQTFVHRTRGGIELRPASGGKPLHVALTTETPYTLFELVHATPTGKASLASALANNHKTAKRVRELEAAQVATNKRLATLEDRTAALADENAELKKAIRLLTIQASKLERETATAKAEAAAAKTDAEDADRRVYELHRHLYPSGALAFGPPSGRHGFYPDRSKKCDKCKGRPLWCKTCDACDRFLEAYHAARFHRHIAPALAKLAVDPSAHGRDPPPDTDPEPDTHPDNDGKTDDSLDI